MQVIGRDRLLAFAKKHPQAAKPLDVWFRIMETVEFERPNEIAAQFGSQNVSFLGAGLTVFDISGNKYRLVVVIVYDEEVALIRHVFTHAEYDKWNKKRR